MKVLLYTEGLEMVKKSGLGRAIEHQKKALTHAGVAYTTDARDSWDVVHINTYGLRSRALARRARRQGKAVVYHAHSTQEDFRNSFRFSNQLAPLFLRWIKSSYNLGDVIITPTLYSKRLLEGYGIQKPIYAISNGIEFDFYQVTDDMKRAFRERYGYREGDKVVMAVGLYIERKGILDFVELARRMPHIQFIWFGSLSLAAVPQKIADAVHTKLPNLIFAGYVEPEFLRCAYGGADLYLFPTLEETEGIVLLEALAAGQNVLVRDIPIYDNWFQDGVNLYKAKSLEEFIHKIDGITSGRLPSLAEAGQAEAKKKDLKNIGADLKRAYERALEIAAARRK